MPFWKHESGMPSDLNLDDPAALVMQRPLRGMLEGQELAVVSPEDFIVMKVLSTRDRDLEDARTIVDALGGRLDEELMRSEVGLLAAEITDHDVRGRFDSIFK